MSSYGAINGVGAKGGAAAAYGINVLGGLAENLTAAEITVQATGGTSYDWGDVANYEGCVNADGAGVTALPAVTAQQALPMASATAAAAWV